MRWNQPRAQERWQPGPSRGRTRNSKPRRAKHPKPKLGPGLVLGRYDEQQIEFALPDGGTICVTVFECKEGRTRVHIDAPAAVGIRRGELERKETSFSPEATADGVAQNPRAANAEAA